MEVYKERVQDLITPRAEDLKIQQDADMGLWVMNATQVPVGSLEEVFLEQDQSLSLDLNVSISPQIWFEPTLFSRKVDRASIATSGVASDRARL